MTLGTRRVLDRSKAGKERVYKVEYSSAHRKSKADRATILTAAFETCKYMINLIIMSFFNIPTEHKPDPTPWQKHVEHADPEPSRGTVLDGAFPTVGKHAVPQMKIDEPPTRDWWNCPKQASRPDTAYP